MVLGCGRLVDSASCKLLSRFETTCNRRPGFPSTCRANWAFVARRSREISEGEGLSRLRRKMAVSLSRSRPKDRHAWKPGFGTCLSQKAAKNSRH
jgi:hypothetical protein